MHNEPAPTSSGPRANSLQSMHRAGHQPGDPARPLLHASRIFSFALSGLVAPVWPKSKQGAQRALREAVKGGRT